MANKNKKLDDGERASPDCSESAETGAAATGVLDDRGPPCGSAGAGAAATGMLDDGELTPTSGDEINILPLCYLRR